VKLTTANLYRVYLLVALKQGRELLRNGFNANLLADSARKRYEKILCQPAV
jgi:hypothetical protein